MADELQNDPFVFRSPLFLLPQTLGRLSIKAMESESTEEILKSLALKNASQLLEQAKAVLDSSSEFLRLESAHKLLSKDVDVAVAEESAHKLLSKDVDVAVAEKVTDCRQRRRPAMGRKRAQFLFKPNHSQAFPQVGSSLDIDHLQDPDEFFKAFERLENAEKELKKSRGYSLEEPIQQSQSMLAKRRRPGILGKTVNYKHLYPMHSGNVNTVPLQGNKVEAKLLSPSKPLLEMRSTISQHPELTSQLGESCDRATTDGKLAAVTQDSVAGMENNDNKLLNELLSNQRGLNMEQTVTLLQDCLHVKPVVLEDIHLPELNDVQINYLEASQEPLSRPRKALADLQQVMNIMSNAKNQQENEIVTFPQRLPTLPRSPFAPMSVLQRHFLQDRLGDSPSGHLGTHVSHHEHSSLSKRKDKCANSPVVDTDEPDTISLSPFGDPTLEGKSLCMDGLLQPPIAELSNTNTTGSNIGAQEEATKDTTSQFNEPIGSKSSEFVADMATRSDGLDSTFDDKVKDMFPETSVSEDLLWEGLTSGAAHSNEVPTETCLSMDRHLRNPSILQEQFNEVPLSHSACESEANIKVKREAPLRKQSKRNVSLLRKSLAGAGTKLESGLRRSTRIKSRPLQYWRGERFLYGRIHDSLPTVIGMKYASPAKGREEPALKVKSYVSDEYAELVEIASLH